MEEANDEIKGSHIKDAVVFSTDLEDLEDMLEGGG